jgi:dTDP-4-dehydrorhamnose reductase
MRVLILGSKGTLGSQLVKVFGSEAAAWDRTDADVTDFANLKSKILNLSRLGNAKGRAKADLKSLPDAIINCVAFNNVDGAEEKKEEAFKLNAELPGVLSEICKELSIPLVHFSTNYVFDSPRFAGEAGGEKGEYTEADKPNPLSLYAKSKYEGEQNIIKGCEKYYIVRTSVLFGPKGQSESVKQSFVDLMLGLAKSQKEIKAVNDEINSVTYAVDLAWAVKVLLSQKFPFGIYHFSNLGSASWYDLAKEIFRIKGLDVKVAAVLSSDFPRKAIRPKKAVLLNTKFIAFRPWQEALSEFLNL